MNIQVATFCDSAADYYGKLCVLGAFDTIMAREAPAVHLQCSIALRFIFRKGEEGDHELTVRIIDEDGQMIVPPITERIPVRLPEDAYFISRNVILNLQQLRFPREGQYAVEVNFDGNNCVSVPLQVRLMKEN